ncbi:MAG: DUF2490 domain-containing protein [Chlamydiota bacterium]|nr:DUF2490 domain-containing protein [Chlamydiota bacterium]
MKKLLIGVVMLMLYSSTAFTQVGEEGDWQWWDTNVIGGHLSDNIKADLEAEFRLGDDISEFYYTHEQIQLHFKLCEYFTFSPAYRQVFEKKGSEWENEARPMINGTVSYSWENGWDVSNRARVEFRLKEGSDDTIRFRNKVTVKFPFEWTSLGIRPYLADEIFIESDGKGFNRNRVYVGIECTLLEGLKGGLFYVLQSSDSGDEWTNIHGVGTSLKLYF